MLGKITLGIWKTEKHWKLKFGKKLSRECTEFQESLAYERYFTRKILSGKGTVR